MKLCLMQNSAFIKTRKLESNLIKKDIEQCTQARILLKEVETPHIINKTMGKI